MVGGEEGSKLGLVSGLVGGVSGLLFAVLHEFLVGEEDVVVGNVVAVVVVV